MRAQRGAQRERLERRDEHRDGDGERELLVEAAGDPRDERHRNEHRGHAEGDRDDRSAHLLHRLERRVPGRHALLDVVLDRLDHDDGVVDHEADGEHQPEERQRVDGEAEQREDRERADERDRHGEERNERGPPALQEEEDDERPRGRRPRRASPGSRGCPR